MRRARIMLVALAIGASACRYLSAEEDVPALLVSPTPEIRAEIRAALAAALGTEPVAVADDAFTRSSRIVIERAPVREGASRPLTGRTIEAEAHRFQLVVNDGRCALVRRDEVWRMPLPTAVCRPE